MAGTFIDMVNRIASELRRSNSAADIKNAINDAVNEASNERFYFNDTNVSFLTVPGQFGSYSDGGAGVVGIEFARYSNTYAAGDADHFISLEVITTEQYSNLTDFNRPSGSQPEAITRDAYGFIIYPTPSVVTSIVVNGYGRMLPFPFVNDADTNAWMTDGEPYIRALAKRNFLRDVVRDYGEARVYDTIAEDYRSKLTERTLSRKGVGTIRGTQF